MGGKYMLFSHEQANIIYDGLYEWLAVHTPGSRALKSVKKAYHKALWTPVMEIIEELRVKKSLNNEEKYFLKNVVYNGTIYRIQNYDKKNKGHVCETTFYMAWSKDIEGVSNVTNLYGDILLLIGNAEGGIDIFGLLTYLLKYKCVTRIGYGRNPSALCRYEKEHEVAFQIQFQNIKDIRIIDQRNLKEWELRSEPLPKEMWERNTLI